MYFSVLRHWVKCIWTWPLHGCQALDWRLMSPGATAGPLPCSENISPTCRQLGHVRPGPADMWVCACELPVSHYIVLGAFMPPSTERYTVPSCATCSELLFCCFLNIPNVEFLITLRTWASFALSVHWRIKRRPCHCFPSQSLHPIT